MPEDSFHEARSAMTEGGQWYGKYPFLRSYLIFLQGIVAEQSSLYIDDKSYYPLLSQI